MTPQEAQRRLGAFGVCAFIAWLQYGELGYRRQLLVPLLASVDRLLDSLEAELAQ